MFTKLAGVTFEGRQGKIMFLKANDRLKLKKTPNKFHDKAILVTTQEGKELGFIRMEIADKIFDKLDNNYYCKVMNITGTDILGVNIFLEFFEDEKSCKGVHEGEEICLKSMSMADCEGCRLWKK